MNGWKIAIIVYSLLAVMTIIPTLNVLIRKKDDQLPDLYSELDLSDHDKQRLQTNYETLFSESISGWGRSYRLYSSFQWYSLLWTILASVLVPILAQAIDSSSESKWFLTLVSLHASVFLGLAKGFAVDEKVKLYRDGQDELSDLNRKIRVDPDAICNDPQQLVITYIRALDEIVLSVREGEARQVTYPETSAVTPPKLAGPKT